LERENKLKVIEIPFNRFVGITKSDKAEYILMLPENPDYLNHIGTVHASAQYALAEASSGEYLLSRFSNLSENIISVVRRVEIKYSKPAKGKLYSRTNLPYEAEAKVRSELQAKGRTMITVEVNVLNLEEEITMKSIFEWFIQAAIRK
jgi:acyl-coenzyme A thioesterase PaaI-like protein